MMVKINCESVRVESADAVASLFERGALCDTPKAVSNCDAENGVTFVFSLLYGNVAQLAKDVAEFCDSRWQDCVAVKYVSGTVLADTGMLMGPRADKWGEFSPNYFID